MMRTMRGYCMGLAQETHSGRGTTQVARDTDARRRVPVTEHADTVSHDDLRRLRALIHEQATVGAAEQCLQYVIPGSVLLRVFPRNGGSGAYHDTVDNMSTPHASLYVSRKQLIVCSCVYVLAPSLSLRCQDLIGGSPAGVMNSKKRGRGPEDGEAASVEEPALEDWEVSPDPYVAVLVSSMFAPPGFCDGRLLSCFHGSAL
jgi:hypothetical protein